MAKNTQKQVFLANIGPNMAYFGPISPIYVNRPKTVVFSCFHQKRGFIENSENSENSEKRCFRASTGLGGLERAYLGLFKAIYGQNDPKWPKMAKNTVFGQKHCFYAYLVKKAIIDLFSMYSYI